MSPVQQLIQTIHHDAHLKYLLKVNHGSRNWSLHFIHDQPRVSSTIDIAIIASGTARVNLSALVRISAAAINTRTSLNIHVLTMDQAKVTAAPDLELANHNVQASHSLFTAHLSSSELFYLASRGLTPDKARALLINSLEQHFQQAQRLT